MAAPRARVSLRKLEIVNHWSLTLARAGLTCVWRTRSKPPG